MRCQMPLLPERFPAIFTLKPLFPRVNEQVIVEMCRVLEHFVAELALVHLLRVVDRFAVMYQRGLLPELCVADLALEEFLPSVDEHVHFEALVPAEPLPTLVAPEKYWLK